MPKFYGPWLPNGFFYATGATWLNPIIVQWSWLGCANMSQNTFGNISEKAACKILQAIGSKER